MNTFTSASYILVRAAILLCILNVCISQERSSLISFDLEPTTILYHEKYLNRHRRLQSSSSDDDETQHNHLPIISYHPFNTGVYSSVVELDSVHYIDSDGVVSTHNSTMDLIHDHVVREHNKLVNDFNALRHLSRYERGYIENIVYTENDGNFTNGRRLQLQNTNLRGGLPPLDDMAKEQLNGGLYNGFQTAPLAQGYGTHYATVWVGTPTPQRKTLIVDTGSHHTAFPCLGCTDCGEEHHTDTYFDPNKSETFHPLQCHECRYEARCDTTNVLGAMGSDTGNLRNNACIVSQSYTEGSAWSAYQVRDRLFCGGKDVFSAADPIDQQYAVQFMFGCQINTSGLFHSQLADGIMGLSQHEATLPRVMYNQGKLQHRMFSLCFRTELVVSKRGVSAGVLTLGGIDRRLHTSPMVYAKNLARTGWFTVYVKNVYLRKADTPANDRSNIIQIPIDTYAVNSDKGVIIDSGTTDSYLQKSMKQPFNEIWKKVTGKSYSNSPVKLSREQVLQLPTILIQVMAYTNELDSDFGPSDDVAGLIGSLDPESPNDVLLAIPPSHYMEYSPSKDVYTSRLYFTESRGGVLGANSLQGHDVLFDWGNGRIGFAESDCSVAQSNWEGGGLASDGAESRGQDCIMQPFVMSKSCYETVDASICRIDKEAILIGVETVTSVVEYPGTTGGFNCEEVIKQNVFNTQLRDNIFEVSCNDSGLCTATQRCEMSCQKFDELKILDESKGSDGMSRKQCGEESWGACLDSCKQAKISSVLRTDEECHEVENDRLERTCHTEYCGIHDPCVIPFVVHVILALRGVSHKDWDKTAELGVIEAFASSVRDTQGNVLFEATDVELLMTTPWFEEISGSPTGETTQIAGTKAVIEVHIFNDASFQSNLNKSGANVQNKVSTILGNKPKESPECRSSDLFQLAQKAHEIHFILDENDFMPQMAQSIQRIMSKTGGSQALSPLINDQKNIKASHVVSSWTIKTAIGGGSVYDHKLDPFPGAISYVHVTPAYLSVQLDSIKTCSIIIVCLLAFYFFRRKNNHKKNDDSDNNLNFNRFKPKPLEMVRRKLIGAGAKEAKYLQNEVVEETKAFIHRGRDDLPIAKDARCRSRLNDIIEETTLLYISDKDISAVVKNSKCRSRLNEIIAN